MPIFVEWEWKEETETFLAIFHFWDDRQKTNLRIRTVEEPHCFEAFISDTDAVQREEFAPVGFLPFEVETTRAYLSWAPSHPEFCFMTEVLTYANLINGQKPHNKRKLRPKLEGRTIDMRDEDGHGYVGLEVHSELLYSAAEVRMVSFADRDRLCFEVCLGYLEYLRKLLKLYLS